MIEYKKVIINNYNNGIVDDKLELLGKEGWLLLTHTSFVSKSGAITHHYTFMQEKVIEFSIPEITVECNHKASAATTAPVKEKQSFFQRMFNYGA